MTDTPDQPPGQPPNWGQPMPPPGGWRPYEAAKPGVIPLRPLGLGEILDGAISTMRKHPRLMLGVAAIVVTVAELLTLAVTYPWLDDINRALTLDPASPTFMDEFWDFYRSALTIAGIALLIILVSRVFLSGFITFVVGKSVLGQPAAFGEVWSGVRPRLLPLLGLTLIYPAVIIVAAFLLVMIAIVAPPLAILLILAAIPIAIWLLVLFSLATPALVLESAGIGRAFGRSRRLVRGSWWRIFGITLLTGVLAGILALIISLPFEYLGDGFASVTSTEPTPPTTKSLVFGTIGGIIASTITEPFVAAVTVLLYTDQRMRREGMDIELTRAAGLAPPPPPQPM